MYRPLLFTIYLLRMAYAEDKAKVFLHNYYFRQFYVCQWCCKMVWYQENQDL